MSLRRWITAEPTRIVTAAFALVLVASAIGIGLVVERDLRHALTERQDLVEIAKGQLETKVRRIEDLIVVLRSHAESFLRERPADGAGPRDPRVSEWLAGPLDGIHSFDRAAPAERGSEMGNLMALSDERARAAGFERDTQGGVAQDADLALDLTRPIRGVHERSNSVGSIYVATPRGVAYAYPWRSAGDLAFDESFFLYDLYQYGHPSANPGRTTYWTPAHKSGTHLGQVVAHGVPIYERGRFAGVITMEVAVSDLRASLRSADAKGPLLLVDERRRILADTASGATEMPSLAERLPESLHGPVLGALARRPVGQTVGDDVAVTHHRLDAAPWILVEILPLRRLYMDVVGLYAPPVAAYLGILVALFLLTHVVIGRTFGQAKAANAALDIARARAEEATQAKSSFLAMMSHEIRTPMNGVMSMAEMLEQTRLSSDQRSMSQVIRASAQALLTIINDILDFSKIEAGKLDIEAVAFSLVEAVEDAGELIAGRADEKGLTLVVDLDPEIPDRLIGDPARLRQILLNLMGNAVKFTETGGVTLSVERAAEAGRTERLRFAIVDTGIGLDAEQRGRLFQPFQQADTSTSRRYGGTGLGLSICRRLVDMMGGTIGVESTPRVGSTFWVELAFPVADPARDRPEPAIADASVTAVGFAGAERRALERLLAAAGIAARFSPSDEVSTATAGTRPDLFLLAGGPDPAATLALGSALAASGLKVALAAPRAMVSSLSQGDRSDFVATMTLPLRRRRLWHVVAAVLGRADLDEAGVAGASEETGFAPPPVEEARAAGALVLVAEDNPTNRTVIARLLSRLGYAHEMAENGRAALAWIDAGGGFGLLLTDFHMPEMDGFELTAAVRAGEAANADGRRLPIVALTADALAGTEQRCRDAGMDGYLTKPIDSRLLSTTLARLLPQALALRRRAAAESPKAAAPAVPPVDPQVLDLQRVVEAFGGVTADALGFLGGFAAQARRLAEAAAAAIEAGDRPAARHHVHALKGAARSSGATRLGQLASDIQDCLDGDDLDSARLFAGGLAKTVAELADAVASLPEPV